MSINVRAYVAVRTLVLASGWIGWGLDQLMGNLSVESIGMLLLIIINTPLIVSLLLRTFGGDGWKDFGIKPNFKGSWIWYLVLHRNWSWVASIPKEKEAGCIKRQY